MPNSLSLIRRIKEPTELGDLPMKDDTLVQVTGHIGKAPMTRQAGSKVVTSVGIAVNFGRKPNQITIWYNCDAWEDQAEILSDFLKGEAICVTGPRKSREYNDKVYWSVTAWEIARPEWKRRNAAQTPARDAAPKQTQKELDDDGDVPF